MKNKTIAYTLLLLALFAISGVFLFERIIPLSSDRSPTDKIDHLLADVTSVHSIDRSFPNDFIKEFCDYIILIQHDNIELRTVLYGYFDVTNDGEAELVTRSKASLSTGQRDTDIEDSTGVNTSIHYLTGSKFNHTYGMRYIPYKNRTFILNFKNQSLKYLVNAEYITPDKTIHTACNFETVTGEAFLPFSEAERPLCQKIESGNDTDIRYIEAIPLDNTAEVKASDWRLAEKAINMTIVDFNNDRKEDKLINFASYSKKDKTLLYNFYDLPGRQESQNQSEDILILRKIQRDTHTFEKKTEKKWLHYKSKNYLEIKSITNPVTSDDEERHDVYLIENNKAEKICSSYFSSDWRLKEVVENKNNATDKAAP